MNFFYYILQLYVHFAFTYIWNEISEIQHNSAVYIDKNINIFTSFSAIRRISFVGELDMLGKFVKTFDESHFFGKCVFSEIYKAETESFLWMR